MRPMREVELEETYLGYSVKSMRNKWLVYITTTEHDDGYGDYAARWYCAGVDHDGRFQWHDSMFDDDVLVFTKMEADAYVRENDLEAEVIELVKAARG